MSSPGTELARMAVRQLVSALEQVQAQRDELDQLNGELEQTNRGVVALYAELDERSAQLREASEAKSRFLANVSHELRAPATAIIGLTRLLQDAQSGPLTDDQADNLQLIKVSATELVDRVNDLLDLAKAESNRIEPRWGPADLAALFGQLRGTLRSMARVGVALTVEDPVSVPPIVTDEILLTQILRNLLTNALRFTEQGEVRLTAVSHESGDWIELAVADTGIGIPHREQERVFEEFHQVPGALQVGTTGTGLGLPYARRLTTLLGGTLALRSTPGAGSVFTVLLPVRPSTDSGQPAPDPPRIGRALVVDDDPAFRRVLRDTLEGMAATVAEAADGQDALAMASRDRPDVIFLDLRMPGVSGLEVLDRLATDEVLRDVPVIVVTAVDSAEGRAAVTLNKAEVSRAVVRAALRTALAGDEP